jgi:hypothetical protein
MGRHLVLLRADGLETALEQDQDQETSKPVIPGEIINSRAIGPSGLRSAIEAPQPGKAQGQLKLEHV